MVLVDSQSRSSSNHTHTLGTGNEEEEEVGAWRFIKDLTQSAPPTIPGRSRRVLFLAQLKDRKIFGLCFLCLNCDAHNSGGIFGS